MSKRFFCLNTHMINGKQLRKQGWESGPWIGQAIALSQQLGKQGYSRQEVWDTLCTIKEDPDSVGEEAVGYALAQSIIAGRRPEPVNLRDEVLPYGVWGESLIPENAFSQMNQAMELPVVVGGALMPDAHHGYGIPIGGVVAMEHAVAPYMVGVDIACRMMMTIYPTDDLAFLDKNNERERLRRALRSETRFGLNAGFDGNDRRDSWLLDDARWDALPLLKGLKDKADRQLGSSGGGNHFVDAGVLVTDETSSLNLEPGTYFALMSHSGSRGVGARIADEYSKRAMDGLNLPKSHRHLAWLDLDSEAGQEYWLAMNLAGDFASECHHAIHRTIAKKLGIERIVEVENHHNFAWKERWNGRDVIVHRKGATPAHKGALGVIPGSQGHDSFIVEGLGNEASLHTASHGAGRMMSRKAALSSLSRSERDALLAQRGIELLGSSMDEAPGAYKNIRHVLAAQTDLVKPLAVFSPKMVIMAE